MSVIEEIFLDVSPLKSIDKLQLVDKILASLTPIDKDIENIWSKESENRVEAYNQGLLSAVDEKEVFSKYKK